MLLWIHCRAHTVYPISPYTKVCPAILYARVKDDKVTEKEGHNQDNEENKYIDSDNADLFEP